MFNNDDWDQLMIVHMWWFIRRNDSCSVQVENLTDVTQSVKLHFFFLLCCSSHWRCNEGGAAREWTCKQMFEDVSTSCVATCGRWDEACAAGSTMTEVYKTEPDVLLYKSDEKNVSAHFCLCVSTVLVVNLQSFIHLAPGCWQVWWSLSLILKQKHPVEQVVI